MKVFSGRMCDVDGCSSTDNLTRYENDVDLCQHHKYLAKNMQVGKPLENQDTETKDG